MMSLSINVFIAIIGAYIIGALPIGFWIAQWAGVQDIRRYGSGNIGATNVARMLGLHFFFIVFFLDAFKAYFYLKLCIAFGIPHLFVMFVAYGLLIGNAYSFLLQGSGGKGMATLIGIMLAMNPWLCVALIITWMAALIYMQVVGMASIFTAFMLPWYALIFTDTYGFFFLMSLTAWILWRHRDNMRVYYAGRM